MNEPKLDALVDDLALLQLEARAAHRASDAFLASLIVEAGADGIARLGGTMHAHVALIIDDEGGAPFAVLRYGFEIDTRPESIARALRDAAEKLATQEGASR
ncbi:MAG TPA: hypothetical protein VGI39_16880 [Polyangiaceae bacterium]|jgi:hypothetical protein